MRGLEGTPPAFRALHGHDALAHGVGLRRRLGLLRLPFTTAPPEAATHWPCAWAERGQTAGARFLRGRLTNTGHGRRSNN